MQSTRIIKHIDNLGRFKLPMELLKQYDIKPNSRIKLTRGKARIVIEQETRKCIFCHSSENIHVFKDRFICEKCIQNIVNQLNSLHSTIV